MGFGGVTISDYGQELACSRCSMVLHLMLGSDATGPLHRCGKESLLFDLRLPLDRPIYNPGRVDPAWYDPADVMFSKHYSGVLSVRWPWRSGRAAVAR